MWAERLQTIAQAGRTYWRDPYDRERCEAVQAIAAEILAAHVDVTDETAHGWLRAEEGYATPKVDVRAVVGDAAGKILLVRESGDGRWALPGGWADPGSTPAEMVVREVREETGYEVRATKLLAVLDKRMHEHPPHLWYVYKLFFRCELEGGAPRPSLETTEVAWFAEDALPPLSLARNTPDQLARMFLHLRSPERPTDFD